jgi:hypothetical protein
MQEVFFLSSMDSELFSSVFRCEVERPLELPTGHHALMVSCDPPVNGQELGHPLATMSAAEGMAKKTTSEAVMPQP